MFFDKFVIISLCFALIDTKTLVQKKLHNEVEEIRDLDDAINSVKFSQQQISSLVEKSEKNQYDKNVELESKKFSLKKTYKDEKETNEETLISHKEKTSKNEKTDDRLPNHKKSASSNKQQSVDKIISQIFLKQMESYPNDEFQDLKDLLKKNIVDQDVQYSKKNQADPAVGFGGNSKEGPRVVFGNMTTYVNKAIHQIQRNLEQNWRRIYANNPPYVIYRIPHTPIIFKLKYIEGADTLATQGTSMGLHYFDAVYTYNQFKFEEIKYIYEVQIKVMNLFTISKSVTVILENPRVYMPTAFENNNLIVQRFEFIKPDVTVDCADSTFINYILNDIVIDEYYPDTKERLAQIASRDTKLILDSQLENAQ